MDEATFQKTDAEMEQYLTDLVKQYGPEAVVDQLKKHYPQVDFSAFERELDQRGSGEPATLGQEPQQLQEFIGRLVSWGGPKLWSLLKGALGIGAGAAAGIATGVSTTAMRGLGRMLGKSVDQDVKIADVASDIVLKVSNPELEELIVKTNQLLATMAGQLVQDMEQLDLSMDHIAAGLTGTSVQDVQGQQAVGATDRGAQTLVTPEKEKEEKPKARKQKAPERAALKKAAQ